MATENEEYVVLSKVRPGLKREFEFAMKSQCELSGSMSRLRVRKGVTGSDSSVKRKLLVGESDVEEQAKSVVVDLTSEIEGVVVESRSRVRRKKENGNVRVTDCDRDGDGVVDDFKLTGCDIRKVKVEGKENGVPTRMKELLETGILEGLNVSYIRGIKSGEPRKLAGVIKGTGILCFCDKCKGVQIVVPAIFELHAGSGNKRPADYIHLENGKSIRDVLNACKSAEPDSVEAVIRKSTGSSPKKEESAYCRSCTGSISETATWRRTLLCDSCYESSVPQTTPKQAIIPSESIDRSVQRESSVPQTTPKQAIIPSESIGRSVQRDSLQRTCNIAPKATSSSSSKSQGKITRKDLRLHKLVFEDDVLLDGTELGYYVNGKKHLSGYKKGSGICCGCCNAVVSASTFESHAGYASRRKPYLRIYTSNGMSLHEISVKISQERGVSTDDNDELCNICQCRGELLCCDGCPRVFHLDCVSLPSIPEGKWYCKLCDENLQVERCAEMNPNAIAAGRIPGVDPMEQITNRCIRIVKILDNQNGGCALCRIQDFVKAGFGPRTVIICDQCEKEYHVGCMRENKMQDLQELPEGDWFCTDDCERINFALKELLMQGDQMLPDDLVQVVKKKLTEEESNGGDLDIRWRVLHGRKSPLDETQPLLSKAVSVFHEQFDPILYGPNKQDLIPHIVYGRNVKETEFGGMYCAVLSVNSTIVSAGVFRVFSKEVAEIPLVATSRGSEGKGYFQCLYVCLERFLKDLGVKNLLLPSAEETRSLWTNRFGFNEIQKEKLNELRTAHPLLIFDGTSMLRKEVVEPSS